MGKPCSKVPQLPLDQDMPPRHPPLGARGQLLSDCEYQYYTNHKHFQRIGARKVDAKCLRCGQQITTNVKYVWGTCARTMFGCGILMACIPPLFLLFPCYWPWYCHCFSDAEHWCPNCHRRIHRHRRCTCCVWICSICCEPIQETHQYDDPYRTGCFCCDRIRV